MKRVLLAAVIPALLLSSGCASASTAAQTKIVSVNPATMTATHSVTGNCWTTSIASRRNDAFRCMSGNGIYDPCFKINSSAVACPANPAANTGVRISLTKPLPSPNAGNTRNPWMMQLSGGETCNLGTGTVIPDYPFYCAGNIVCAVPAPAASTRSVYVQCGRPENATSVTGARRYLVAVLYV